MRKETCLRLFGAGLGLLVLGCEQPRPSCSIARGDFAATYRLVSGSGPCAELRGDILAVDAYSARTSASDPSPDYDRTTVGIEPHALLDLSMTASPIVVEGEATHALGPFSKSRPDDDDLCHAPQFSVARLRLPERSSEDLCADPPTQPATDIAYVFSNLRVQASADAYGTSFRADLTYTQDGCTALYEVTAVYPAVSCAASVEQGGTPPAEMPPAEMPPAEMPPAEMPPAEMPVPEQPPLEETPSEPEELCPAEPPAEPAQAPVADERLCSPVADPAHGISVGSGINAAFAVRCDPELLLCVLRTESP